MHPTHEYEQLTGVGVTITDALALLFVHNVGCDVHTAASN